IRTFPKSEIFVFLISSLKTVPLLITDKSLTELTPGLLFPLRPKPLNSMRLSLSQGIKTAITVQR
ncbi:hypothetical protein, partial [Klebsiella pneumoniae]|uniref:hypothetical protein n=1 Tax=Klebsiella pneumoniae TaxID=573 RepID=UPI003EE2D93D